MNVKSNCIHQKLIAKVFVVSLHKLLVKAFAIALIIFTSLVTTSERSVATSDFYCLLPAGTGYQLSWKNSKDLNWGNPSLLTTPGSWVYLTSEATWRGMAGQTKYALHQTQLKEIAIKPVPPSGCASLNEDLSYLSNTTTTSTSTAAPTTTTTSTTAAPTTTTTSTTAAPITTTTSTTAAPTTTTSAAPTLTTTTTTASAARSCSTGYSSNRYYNGSWFNFSSNAVVASMIASKEMQRIFTTNENSVSLAIPVRQFAIACVSPSFSIQSTGTRGLYLVGSGWDDAGFQSYSLVSLTNAYLSANYIYPTTTTTSLPTSTSIEITQPTIVESTTSTSTTNAIPNTSSVGPSSNTPKTSSNKCVGVCYGVTSPVNGLPRNTFVPGYTTKKGKKVQPFTRSSPKSSGKSSGKNGK